MSGGFMYDAHLAEINVRNEMPKEGGVSGNLFWLI